MIMIIVVIKAVVVTAADIAVNIVFRGLVNIIGIVITIVRAVIIIVTTMSVLAIIIIIVAVTDVVSNRGGVIMPTVVDLVGFGMMLVLLLLW